MRTLISNGTIVTADGSSSADVLIDGERIVQIGAGLASNAGVAVAFFGDYIRFEPCLMVTATLGYAGGTGALQTFDLEGGVGFGNLWLFVTYEPKLLAGSFYGTEPLVGMLKPTPIRRMSPSDARCGPWLAVMIRTSWPCRRRFSYR